MDVTRSEVVPAELLLLADGSPVTGATVVLDIRRAGDGFVVDWADGALKALPVGTRYKAVPEVSATDHPGLYQALVDLGLVGGINDNPPVGDTLTVTFYEVTAGPVYAPLDDEQWRVGPSPLNGTEVEALLGDALGPIMGADFDPDADNLHAIRVAIPNAATISAQVAADLATAHGAGSWLTPDISGLATSLGLAAAVATLEGYGDAHWSTANVSALATTAQLDAHAATIQGAGFTAGVDDLHSLRARGDASWATPATVVLSDSSLSAAKLGAGFVNAIQANLALEATLTAMKGASFDGTTDSLRAMRVLISALPTTAAPSASDVATEVWAETEGGAEGTLRYSITLLRKRQTGRRKMGNDGYELIYDDDNVTVIKKTLVKDIEGNIVVPGAGDPAEVSQEMAP